MSGLILSFPLAEIAALYGAEHGVSLSNYLALALSRQAVVSNQIQHNTIPRKLLLFFDPCVIYFSECPLVDIVMDGFGLVLGVGVH